MKCCVNPFAQISPTRNLHFKKKACIHLRKKFEFICVYSTSICRLKTSRASPPADEQDTKTEVQQSHDALRVSPGPEREVLSTIQCPRPQYSAPFRTGERPHTIKCTRTATRLSSLEHIATYTNTHTHTHIHTKIMHILDHVVFVKYRYSSRYESWMEMLRLGLRKHACMALAAIGRLTIPHPSLLAQYNLFFFFFSDYEKTNMLDYFVSLKYKKTKLLKYLIWTFLVHRLYIQY